MTTGSDLELAERWRAGDRRAGDELTSRYSSQLLAYFINAVGEQDHLDLLQETFERLTKSLPNFAGTSSFRAYLFKIAQRARTDFYRRKYQMQDSFESGESSVEEIQGVTLSSTVALLEGGRRLNACVRRLPIDDREMVELFYWHGWKAIEIAELFSTSGANVRMRLHRARIILRHCLDASKDLEDQLHELGRELGIPGASVGSGLRR